MSDPAPRDAKTARAELKETEKKAKEAIEAKRDELKGAVANASTAEEKKAVKAAKEAELKAVKECEHEKVKACIKKEREERNKAREERNKA